jgi:hypothetical protein
MISLENVSINTLGVGNRRIQWEVVPTHEDLNTYVLDLYRAEAPGDLSEFEVVVSGIASSDGIYIDSGLERMDFSGNRKIYYYINPRNTSTLETSSSGPYVMESVPDYVANEIIRTYSLFFENPRYKTRTFTILKKRTWGNYCECVDPITQESRDKDCPLCYGTAIEGGYFNPISIRGMRSDKPSRQMINLFGAWHDTNVFFKLQNTVEVVPGDTIVDEHGERYLVESPVNHLQKGIYTIMQNVRAKTVSKVDGVYNYDLTETFGGIVASGQETQPYGIFNGSAYAEVPDDDRFSFGDGSSDSAFSVTGWINMVDATNFQVACKIGGAGFEWYFYVDGSDDLTMTLMDDIPSNTQFKAIQNMTSYENGWIFICATYDGRGGTSAREGINMYLNAQLETNPLSGASGTYVAMNNSDAPLLIGSDSINYANGYMKDIKVFSKELAQADINQEYTLGNYTINMIAHYKLDINTDDSGRYGIDATNNGITFG